MITNSLSVSKESRKISFKVLSVVIAILIAFSVTASTLAFASAHTQVTVTDGEKSVTVSADSTEPNEIVKLAGFTLGANDKLDLSDYTEAEGGTIAIERAKIVRVDDNGIIAYFVGYNNTLGEILDKSGIAVNSGDDIGENPADKIFNGMKVFIKRAFSVSVTADGKTQKLCLANGTVEDALEKAGISVSKDDIVYPSLDTVLHGFTEIKITRVNYEFKRETQAVKHETKTIPVADMYIDESEIITPGEDGEKIVVYSEKYVNGELTETLFSKERITKEPVTEVKKVGTKKREVLSAFKNTSKPISDLKVPSDLKLDENGIPVDYAYCVEGKATAYTGDPATASGRKPMPGHIAVDPKEYPYGTELYVVSADGSYVYGYCIAADTGGFVSMGNTDIDLYMDNKDMCTDWGNRGVKIYVLN